MKFLKGFFFSILILFLIFFAAVTVYVRYNGQQIFETVLNDTLQRKVTIGRVSYIFPLGIRTHDMVVEGIGRVERVGAHISMRSFKDKRLRFSYVFFDHPTIQISPGAMPVAGVPQDTGDDKPAGGLNWIQRIPLFSFREARGSFSIENFYLRHGQVETDMDVFNTTVPLSFSDLWMEVKQLSFPLGQDQNIPFDFHANLRSQGRYTFVSRLKANGWINLVAKDISTRLVMSTYDRSFYLSAALEGKNNNIAVTGELDGADFSLLKDYGIAEAGTLSQDVIERMAGLEAMLDLKFAFQTTMDEFAVEQIDFSGELETK